jgi:hypothetical protein
MDGKARQGERHWTQLHHTWRLSPTGDGEHSNTIGLPSFRGVGWFHFPKRDLGDYVCTRSLSLLRPDQLVCTTLLLCWHPPVLLVKVFYQEALVALAICIVDRHDHWDEAWELAAFQASNKAPSRKLRSVANVGRINDWEGHRSRLK